MKKIMQFQMTAIKKEIRLNMDKMDYLITFGDPEIFEHCEFPITIGSTKEDFDFFEVGKKYEMMVRPLAAEIKAEA